MVRFSVTIKHSLPTTSYPTIFLLPSRIFPIGFFNCCSLVGHSGIGASVFGTVGVFGVGGSGASGSSGDFTGGTSCDFCSVSYCNLLAS